MTATPSKTTGPNAGGSRLFPIRPLVAAGTAQLCRSVATVNAWLLTWECNTAKVRERLVAILSSRRSERVIAELMELLVLRASSTAASVAYYANRRRELVDKAITPLVINGVPYGERIRCGHDPWLYGRKVRELKIVLDQRTDEEVVTWREPDDFRSTNGNPGRIEIAKHGITKEWRRPNRPLSADIWPGLVADTPLTSLAMHKEKAE